MLALDGRVEGAEANSRVPSVIRAILRICFIAGIAIDMSGDAKSQMVLQLLCNVKSRNYSKINTIWIGANFVAPKLSASKNVNIGEDVSLPNYSLENRI